MKRRGILVARVSTKDQAGDQHFSLEAQFRFMRESCERRGIEIIGERVEPGTSAFTSDLRQLPVLHQTILDIESGMANALVMHESSRLARNEQLANHLLDRLTDCGAAYINATIDMDYTSPEGRMLFNNEASNNAYQSRKTSQHSKKGKLEQFLQGLPVGAIHFGYASQSLPDGQANRKLPPLPVTDEAQLIQKAYQDKAIGRSPNEISREWNVLGYKPRSRKGVERFSPQTVRAILSNPFYMGYVVHNGEQRRGLHQPIVTEDEWWAAQHPKKPTTRRRFPPLLLQGLAVCASCGSSIYPSRPQKGPKYPGERYAYYREASPDFNRECVDAGLLWPSDSPDQQVDELMLSLAMSKEWLDYVAAEALKLPEDVVEHRRELEETLRRVQKDYFGRRLDESEYLALRRTYEGELALLPVARRDLINALGQLEAFGDLWVPASAEARNDACRTVFDRVILDMRNRSIELCPSPEFEPLFQLRHALHVTDIRPAQGSR